MRYSIYGKNIDVTDSLKSAITGKFSKLDKYFTEDTEVISFHLSISITLIDMW